MEKRYKNSISLLLHWAGKDKYWLYLAILFSVILHLTDVGREVAEKIYERHCFFTEQLIAAGVNPETAEADACRIEHVISNESFQKLKDALED